MIKKIINFRVLYSDTDKMGFMYYGDYAKYLEMGRVELLRSMDLTYKEIENRGYALPVLEMNIKYIKPLVYDDKVTLNNILIKIKNNRFYFYHEFHKNNILVNISKTTLVTVDLESKKPVRIPDFIYDKLKF